MSMTREGRLDHPVLRLALSVPVLVLVLYAAVDGVARPVVGGGLLLVGAVLAVITLLVASEGGIPGWWQTVATLVGVGLLPVLLVLGLDAPVEMFSLLFVVVVVVGAFSYPHHTRFWLTAWALGVWLLTLWWGGLREPDLLLLHVGAGALAAWLAKDVADALERAVAGESASAAAAERRARLLGRVLAVHALERDEVLQAVVDGLEDVGFAAVSVRVPQDGRLVLAAGLGLHGPLASEVRAEEGLQGLALSTGTVQQVGDPEQLVSLGLEPEARGAIAVPVAVAGRTEAVILGATIDRPVSPQQRETIELLASLAGRALRRARTYAADEHTVEELGRLEARTQDFVSTVSHELRTPLTVVQGLGRTLRTRWDDLDPDRRRDLLRRVEANAGRLADMVRSLLDTSAFEQGGITLSPGPVEVESMVRALLHRLANVTAAHPVSLDLPHGLWVRADRSLLEHVLENLLNNSAKHTPQGTAIEVSARAADGEVEISVTDQGPGIPSADLPHVRDRFYRGGDPLSRPAGGLGLGLALANQILVAHDSELEIASEQGSGASFFFRIPRTEPPEDD